MNRLFVDTFFFFAFLNADDSAHREASTFYDAFDGQLVTTEWILTELADGLREYQTGKRSLIFTEHCETTRR